MLVAWRRHHTSTKAERNLMKVFVNMQWPILLFCYYRHCIFYDSFPFLFLLWLRIHLVGPEWAVTVTVWPPRPMWISANAQKPLLLISIQLMQRTECCMHGILMFNAEMSINRNGQMARVVDCSSVCCDGVHEHLSTLCANYRIGYAGILRGVACVVSFKPCGLSSSHFCHDHLRHYNVTKG